MDFYACFLSAPQCVISSPDTDCICKDGRADVVERMRPCRFLFDRILNRFFIEDKTPNIFELFSIFVTEFFTRKVGRGDRVARGLDFAPAWVVCPLAARP
jgi:hypothetical protein